MSKQNDYFTRQIITYMGNKRKLLTNIELVLDNIKIKLDKKTISVGDGFSGSGIVSRLLKTKADTLFCNDLAGYSHTLNQCYLANPTANCEEKIHTYIDKANSLAEHTEPADADKWVSQHWSPKTEKISVSDRVYFTRDNGQRIDVIRNYIDSIPNKYRPYVLAPLLVESSIHNNTNGQFSAFYKDEGKGAYGGKKSIDTGRIMKSIHIPYPIFHKNKCKVHCSQKDTNQWATDLGKDTKLDIVYYDPPYNKHPYNIYYFMLDIINDWDKTLDIPDTNRGQPLTWNKSRYNSTINAKKAMTELIQNTNASFIILSYNDGGIIPIPELDQLLKDNSTDVEKIPITHKTYNKLKGISNYKREKEYKDVKEFLYVIQKTD
jgi:adenine-specific DNA-methyltransferase